MYHTITYDDMSYSKVFKLTTHEIAPFGLNIKILPSKFTLPPGIFRARHEVSDQMDTLLHS